MWEFLVRWRTWLVNVLAMLLLVLPDLMTALLGFDWGTIVPKQYMPYVTLAIIVVNVWMRPRPASVASDPEVKVKKALKKVDDPATVTVEAGGEIKAVVDA